MKAVAAVDKGTLGIMELEVPVPGRFEALVRFEACGICNSTDLKLLHGEFCPGPFPAVLGHEVVGTVVEAGSDVKNYRAGDLVFRQNLRDDHVPGDGRSCWGGFAEYGLVTDEWARQDLPCTQEALPHPQQKLLAPVEPRLAAGMITLMETLDSTVACGVGGGVSVAVVGSGPVGQSFALFSRVLGARPVYAFGRTDRYAERFASVVGCDGYIQGTGYPREVTEIVGRGGFDIVIEAVGSAEALETAVELAADRGKVFIYGVAPESHGYRTEQLSLENVREADVLEGRAQRKLLEMVDAGSVRLEDWVTDVLPMGEFEKAFELVGEKRTLKCVLTPA